MRMPEPCLPMPPKPQLIARHIRVRGTRLALGPGFSFQPPVTSPASRNGNEVCCFTAAPPAYKNILTLLAKEHACAGTPAIFWRPTSPKTPSLY